MADIVGVVDHEVVTETREISVLYDEKLTSPLQILSVLLHAGHSPRLNRTVLPFVVGGATQRYAGCRFLFPGERETAATPVRRSQR